MQNSWMKEHLLNVNVDQVTPVMVVHVQTLTNAQQITHALPRKKEDIVLTQIQMMPHTQDTNVAVTKKSLWQLILMSMAQQPASSSQILHP